MIGRKLLLAVLALCLSAGVQAGDEKHVKVVGELVVHMGLLPAEMILGHRSATDMHGGVPPGGHVYHVLIAAFDTGTGRRVGDLQEVWATVVGQGEQRPAEARTHGVRRGSGVRELLRFPGNRTLPGRRTPASARWADPDRDLRRQARARLSATGKN